MSKEVREHINKVKNFSQFLNENVSIDDFRKMFLENGFTTSDLNEINKTNYFNNIKINENGLFVYRSISLPEHKVNDFLKLGTNGIGEYWTLRDDLDSVWGSNAEYEKLHPKEKIINIRCKGYLNLSDIDWEMMLYAYNDDFYHFTDEKEIRGKNGGNIIKVMNCNTYT